MSNINKSILTVAACLLIASCDVKIKSDMKFSNIFSAGKKVVMADLSVSNQCSESENDKIIQIFKRRGIVARFIECPWNTMNGYEYSKFSVPIQIVKGDENPDDKYATLYFRYKDDILTIETSSSYSDFIKQGGNSVAFRDLEFEFTNDSTAPLYIKPSLSFVNGKPVNDEVVEIAPMTKITIKLPDVSHQFFKRSNVIYPVFQMTDKTGELNKSSESKPSHTANEEKETNEFSNVKIESHAGIEVVNTIGANNTALQENPIETIDKNILTNEEVMKTITPEQLEEYIAKGADVNAQSKGGRMTALMFASAVNQNPEIIEMLIKHGANIEAKDNSGVTALMHASMNNENPEVIEVLLRHGADIRAKDNSGYTPLNAAEFNGNPEVIEIFLKHGALF